MEKSAGLAGALRAYLEAIALGDIAAVEGMLSLGQADLLLAGTGADEWVGGPGGCSASLPHPDGGDERCFPIVVGDPQGYVAGDVGWAADRPTILDV